MTANNVPALELRGISKRFGGVTAIHNFDAVVARGEVLALVGDNGAGKSTLVKIISGVHQPSGGEILLQGISTNFASATTARERGVEVVYQDLAMADLQPVYMNLFLGRERRSKVFGILDRRRMVAETNQLVDELDVRIPSAHAQLSSLSGGQRQAIAIARATHWAKNLVVMDEPTAALGVAETAKVEALIQRLKDRGAAVLLVSHNMEQVFRVADRVTVLRRGTQVGTRAIAETTHNEIVGMITGIAA